MRVKVAVTVTLVLLVLVGTVHVRLVSLQVLSDQSSIWYPLDGTARSVTDLPQSTVALPRTVPPAVATPVTLQRLTNFARTLTGVGEPPAVPTGTTQLVLVPQPPPVQPVNR